MNIVDCKFLSRHKRRQLKKAAEEQGFVPGLAVILVGNDPASLTYVNNKKKACDEAGFHSEILHMGENSSLEDVIGAIEHFSSRTDIHGMMVQLPLPRHIDASAVLAAIPPQKDVDCLTPTNLGKVMLGEYDYAPCTPTGIINILDEAGYTLSGKNCVIIGRSNIVGKPLAAMLTKRDMTVTLCHSKTKNLAEITRQADVVVCAVGKANFLTADMVSSDAIVIDVGINRTDDGKLVGDICAEEVSAKVRAITPVPGGVGVMTVTALLENTYKAALLSTTEQSEAREE